MTRGIIRKIPARRLEDDKLLDATHHYFLVPPARIGDVEYLAEIDSWIEDVKFLLIEYRNVDGHPQRNVVGDGKFAGSLTPAEFNATREAARQTAVTQTAGASKQAAAISYLRMVIGGELVYWGYVAQSGGKATEADRLMHKAVNSCMPGGVGAPAPVTRCPSRDYLVAEAQNAISDMGWRPRAEDLDGLLAAIVATSHYRADLIQELLYVFQKDPRQVAPAIVYYLDDTEVETEFVPDIKILARMVALANPGDPRLSDLHDQSADSIRLELRRLEDTEMGTWLHEAC